MEPCERRCDPGEEPAAQIPSSHWQSCAALLCTGEVCQRHSRRGSSPRPAPLTQAEQHSWVQRLCSPFPQLLSTKTGLETRSSLGLQALQSLNWVPFHLILNSENTPLKLQPQYVYGKTPVLTVCDKMNHLSLQLKILQILQVSSSYTTHNTLLCFPLDSEHRCCHRQHLKADSSF